MTIAGLIDSNPEILSGTPVFVGTRVPVQTLFWHLEKGISVEEFLEDFPSVSRKQVFDLLHLVALTFKDEKTAEFYESVA